MLEMSVRQLKEDLKATKDAGIKASLNEQIIQQDNEARALKAKADAEKKAADAIYWPIFNLDIKNPHVGEQESHDPKVLLAHYQQQQQSMTDTRRKIKAILDIALSGQAKEQA